MVPHLTAATAATTPAGTSESQAEEASAVVHAAAPSSVPSLKAADTQTVTASVLTNTMATSLLSANVVPLVVPSTALASNLPPTTENDEAPSHSFTSTPQQTPQANLNPTVIRMQRQQIQKVLDLQLNVCTCGVTIMDVEIQEGKSVMQCHVPGCETVWVSAYFTPLFAPNVSNQITLLSFIRNAWNMSQHRESGLATAVKQALHTVAMHSSSIGVLLLNMVA